MQIVRLLSAIVLGGTIVSSTHAITITEDFNAASPGASPFARGWSVVGDTNLFTWNAVAGHLEVTWDSAKPNSFFHQPLGMKLNKTHNFSLGFDLTLSSIQSHPDKSGAMQVAVGFINLEQATNSSYRRATGYESPNLVEFNYFHDTGFGASVSPVAISTNHQYAANFGNYLFELQLNQPYRIEMNYTSANQTLATALKQDGTNVFEVSFALTDLDATFSDITLDTVAISSYSDEGQIPEWAGSILAHGIVDNLVVTTPAPPVGALTLQKAADKWQVTVYCQPGETYVLERTSDFQVWQTVDTQIAPGPQLVLEDSSPLIGNGFYRVSQQPH